MVVEVRLSAFLALVPAIISYLECNCETEENMTKNDYDGGTRN